MIPPSLPGPSAPGPDARRAPRPPGWAGALELPAPSEPLRPPGAGGRSRGPATAPAPGTRPTIARGPAACLPGMPPPGSVRPEHRADPRSVGGLERALAWALLLLGAASAFAPERGLGGASPRPFGAPRVSSRWAALGLAELGPGPLERLRRDPAAPLSPREWRALPGIGHARAAEIEAARRAAAERLDWRRLESITGIGPGTIERLTQALARPPRPSGASGAGPDPPARSAAPAWQRLSWPR